ncbi:PALB protein [Xylariaceae sp. FL1019]|nr:PALB protein [Xylariaceae sp. FL1019]
MEATAKEYERLASTCSGKEALDHVIAAAEYYMKAAHESRTPQDKTRLKKKCEQLVQTAERLKKSTRSTDSIANIEKRLNLPPQVRTVPTSEKTILYRSSRLHGNTFPPWESDPEPDIFQGDLFSDSSLFTLSSKQQAVFAGWKRPGELIREKSEPAKAAEGNDPEAGDDYDLVQDITTDCSVVASLCASMRHLRPSSSSILPALMFPTDSRNGQPKEAKNGRYVFRMFFNGCFRKVVIDDRLPASCNDRTLYVVDRRNPRLLWPALIEKAYLKVRGGYDFPGSNSGTDLSILTGWIPQQLILRSDELDLNATWRRIQKAYDYGDVVITLGTGRLSPDEEETLGLAGEHDYAVLDMFEDRDKDTRLLLVKNPWCEGLVWKGGGSGPSTPDTYDRPVKLKPGSFWISFDDMTQHFESLYLNWNPSLFTQRQDYHFTWQLPEANLVGSFAKNPQYSMMAERDDQTWILLSRHFQDGELEIARTRAASMAAVSNMLGFMSIYIFDNEGRRVELSDKSIYRGPFVDSPQTLAAFESKKGVNYTVVVAVQDLPLPSYSFTLTFFSRTSLAIAPAQDALKYYSELHSSWSRRTSGGNSASPTYLTNPQFSIALTRAGSLSILLSTANDDLPVHVDLVWAGGQRVTAVTVRDLVGHSGDYRRGGARAFLPVVDAGTYTIVCSTFEAGQMADFTLRVGCDVYCDITPVLADAAGRLRTRPPPAVFSGGRRKMRARVSVARLTRVSLVLSRDAASSAQSKSSYGTPRSLSAVRAAIESGSGPHRNVLLSTGMGEFEEVGSGLRTPECDLDPRASQARMLWLVIERMSDALSQSDSLQVELFSDANVTVGAWEAVDE